MTPEARTTALEALARWHDELLASARESDVCWYLHSYSREAYRNQIASDLRRVRRVMRAIRDEGRFYLPRMDCE